MVILPMTYRMLEPATTRLTVRRTKPAVARRRAHCITRELENYVSKLRYDFSFRMLYPSTKT